MQGRTEDDLPVKKRRRSTRRNMIGGNKGQDRTRERRVPATDEKQPGERKRRGSKAASAEAKGQSVFCTTLRSLLRRDRAQVTRVSRALEVAENTVYRWMSGASRPRPVHLKELPDVLPEHRQTLIQAINETFPGTISEATEDVPELPGDVYRRIHYLAATIQDADQCFFTIARELFEQVLQLLGKPQQGMALTYARLMPPRPDAKVHSLYEIFVRGTYPWENEAEGKVFLGRTTLAGNAALTLRTQTWDSSQEQRQPVEVDEHEKSACAAPVMWRGKIAGVIIVSSNRTGMFNNPKMRLLVEEIARLLAIGLSEHDFYAPEQIQLRPMPPLRVQREKVAALYVERALAYARNFKVSGKDAERRVQEELEKEFELMVQ